jgi:hypothetical protein
MNAELIAKALGGVRAGAEWMPRCPVHDDRTPSLSLGTRVAAWSRCHAGCEQEHVHSAFEHRNENPPTTNLMKVCAANTVRRSAFNQIWSFCSLVTRCRDRKLKGE